jgi:multiple sugar transport system ATP-binding protein
VAEIVFEGVGKVYPDGTEAVSDLDLAIDDGEFMVLVGPSGCGKTTALRMVAGLEAITTGKVRIGERIVNDLPPKERDVAMVFQNYALYPHMTVFENMAFALKVRGIDKRDSGARVREAARILGISELLKRQPKALSGGQRQRVAMGRAIVREPSAFLMDEPLSNLDAKLRVQMRAEIARIQARLGTTTMYVTHDQTEAMTMGDRVAVLKKGLLQQVAGPQELYDRPANLFVAGFIGSPAMNMVEATLERDGERLRAAFGSSRLEVDPRVIEARPALRAYEGRDVVLGIRPEDLHDASITTGTPAERRFTATVDLREALGSEVVVHLTVDAPPVLTEDTIELARDRDATETIEEAAAARESTFVARLDPHTVAREGGRLELAVNTASLHFFDPQDGTSIRV